MAIAPKKFHHFNSKTKTSRRVERYRGLLSILYDPMVIYIHPSVYITMTNFSAIFKLENWSLKFPIVSFYVKKDD